MWQTWFITYSTRIREQFDALFVTESTLELRTTAIFIELYTCRVVEVPWSYIGIMFTSKQCESLILRVHTSHDRLKLFPSMSDGGCAEDLSLSFVILFWVNKSVA
jgi:hypothetical protein